VRVQTEGKGPTISLLLSCLLGFCVSFLNAASMSGQTGLDARAVDREATFVFVGQVKALGATTMPELVPASDNLAVVEVQDIVRSPINLSGYVGRSVTVQLLRAGSEKVGLTAVFFTRGWILGDGAAVIEVHQAAGMAAGDAKELLSRGRKENETQNLKDQLSSAPVVITGKVVSVKAQPASQQPTEHDPQWQDATVQITSVEKSSGATPSGVIHVLFPASQDIAWVNSPRFREGQEGVWILHKIPGSVNYKGLAAPSRTFAALSKSDFKSLDDLSTIRALLK
jgi:hypothetical protein